MNRREPAITKSLIRKVRKLFLGPSDGLKESFKYWTRADLNVHVLSELKRENLDEFLPGWKSWSVDRKFHFLLLTGRIY